MADTIAPAELMRSAFEAVAAKNLTALEEMWHDQLEEHFIGLGQTLDRDGARAFFAEMFVAFEDFEFTPLRVMGCGQSSVGEWRVVGTFSGGPWNGYEPTGGRVELRGIDVMEWEDGLLRRNTVYFDQTAIGRQLGLLPAEGSMADRGMTAAFNAVQKLRKRFGRV